MDEPRERSVLHWEHNGVGVVLAEAQRSLGVDAWVVASGTHPFGFREDQLLPPHRRSPGRALASLVEWRRLHRYEVLHSHDVHVPRPALYQWKGATVMHYHAPRLSALVDFADVSLVSLPGALQDVPDGVWIPLPARTAMFHPRLREEHQGVRIGYSAQTLDASKVPLVPVAEVVSAVRSAGAEALLAPLEGVRDQATMPSYYAGIDVWVDRIGCGFYGFAAVEAAAMGIPVITQIGEYERGFVPGCPFVSVQRRDVGAAVVDLIRDREKRLELGERSRRFAVDVHDAVLVARMCLDQYQRLMKGN